MSILASARQAGPSTLASASLISPATLIRPATLVSTVSRTVGIGQVRPWLPAEETLRARAFRHGLEPGAGVAWLDEAGIVDARVRLGYAPSLRGNALTVTTLAVRFDNEDGSVGDLLLRAQLRGPRRRARVGGMLVASTPYLVPGGLLSLGARQCGAETFELCCHAGDDAEWRGFADLRVSPHPYDAQPLRVDPVAHVLPGLETSVPAPRGA